MKRISLLVVFGLLVRFALADVYPVGHITHTFTDLTRSNRAIETEIYYPAALSGDDQPVYAPNGNEQYPVVVFGHGFVMTVDAYDYVQQALAANGFIAAFPKTETGITPSHTDFAKDLAFVGLAVVALNEDLTSILHQRVLNNTAVMGHSMGGGAALLSFQYNPTIKTVFTLAAAETNPSAVSAATGISVPTVYLVGSQDCITPLADHQLPMYNATSPCKYLVNLTSGTHCQFSSGNLACSTGETFSGCANASITDTTQQRIVLDWLLPWLDIHLKNNAAAVNDIHNLEQNPVGFTVTSDCTNLSVATKAFSANVSTAMLDHGVFNVNINDETSPYVGFTVYRMDGTPVLGGSFQNGPNRLSLQKIPPGIYLLACESRRLRETHKLINLR
jgi:dienelactone hydrolase